MQDIQRRDLIDAARSFCNAFASNASLDEILAHFSTSSEPILIEHGLPRLAPFLGKRYTSLTGAREYFNTISSLLTYSGMSFPESEYFADMETRQVSVKGYARFTWRSNEQSWDEVFTYRLAFDEALKVTMYEVWADSGAAYLAGKALIDAARRFCNDFASKKPPADIASHFSETCFIFQYGSEQQIPYMGRKYKGRGIGTIGYGAKDYFEHMYNHLTRFSIDVDFDRSGNVFADTETRQVSVKGHGLYYVRPAPDYTYDPEYCWEEVFAYRLEFDEELKIQKLEVWGDTQNAVNASYA